MVRIFSQPHTVSNRAYEWKKRNLPVLLCRICSYSNLNGKLSGFVIFLWSSYKSWILPRDFNKSINNRLDVHTANVYRDLRILYMEIRVWGFQIYGDCMLPTIPVVLKPPYSDFHCNICREFDFTGKLLGYPTLDVGKSYISSYGETM